MTKSPFLHIRLPPGSSLRDALRVAGFSRAAIKARKDMVLTDERIQFVKIGPHQAFVLHEGIEFGLVGDGWARVEKWATERHGEEWTSLAISSRAEWVWEHTFQGRAL